MPSRARRERINALTPGLRSSKAALAKPDTTNSKDSRHGLVRNIGTTAHPIGGVIFTEKSQGTNAMPT